MESSPSHRMRNLWRQQILNLNQLIPGKDAATSFITGVYTLDLLQ